MSSASYYRDKARLCRDIADRLSVHADAERLHTMAKGYEAEADAIDAHSDSAVPSEERPKD